MLRSSNNLHICTTEDQNWNSEKIANFVLSGRKDKSSKALKYEIEEMKLLLLFYISCLNKI